MPRPYTLKRRAEQQRETRQRIVEAAVALHGERGPAHTPLSLVAERAGVQRNTLYAHFPDERRLLEACSGLSLERDPLPDATPWQALADPRERLRVGLAALYGWYRRNAALAGCVLRDAETHAPTRAIVEQRLGPSMVSYRQVLGAGLGPPGRALLRLALDYFAWRSLVADPALDDTAAAALMADAITAAGP